jgi:hypothetical protein
MPHMGEEIAVLDGLDALVSPRDGRIGRRPATGAEYAKRKNYNYETRNNVLDASEGANYSGGSSYAPRLPLMPSSIGLAAADEDLVRYSQQTSVLPPKRNVVDPSGGANYSGGSNYVPGMPLVVSGDPGLAAMMNPESYDDFAQLDPTLPVIRGGYGSAGLGAGPVAWPGGADPGGYGKAGLGKYTSPYTGVSLSQLDGAFGSTMEIEDGRIGRRPATGVQYASRVSHNFETRSNVLDASEGANYSGGSSYAPRLPLMPSSIGLAGLAGGLAELTAYDQLDGIADSSFMAKLYKPKRAVFARAAGQRKIKSLLGQAQKIRRQYARMTPRQRQAAKAKLGLLGKHLGKIRQIRRAVMSQGGLPTTSVAPMGTAARVAAAAAIRRRLAA